MNIDIETVKKIAHLSRLEFNDAEQKLMENELNKILKWMDKLNEVNTENVEPLIHMSHEINVFREDMVHEHLDHKFRLFQSTEGN